MRLFSKYALADLATTVLGCIGTASVMIGGGACVVGLGSEAIVQVGEALSSIRPIYKAIVINGAIFSGAGLFLIGTAVIAIKIRDNEADKEMEESLTQEVREYRSQTDTDSEEYRLEVESARQILDEINSGKPSCSICHYYSGIVTLPCAVRPLGFTEDCSDYAPKD